MSGIKKYKVIALSVGANSGKIFKAGDIVTSDAWDEGVSDKLVEQDFLEDYTGKEEVGTEGNEVQPPLKDDAVGDHATNEEELGLDETQLMGETSDEIKAGVKKSTTKK